MHIVSRLFRIAPLRIVILLASCRCWVWWLSSIYLWVQGSVGEADLHAYTLLYRGGN